MGIKSKLRKFLLNIILKPRYQEILILEQKIFRKEGSVKSGSSSPERFDILGRLLNSVGERFNLPGFPRSIPYAVSSILDMRDTLKSVNKNIGKNKKAVTPDFIRNLEEYAKSLGIGSIGYVKVPENYIFKDKAVLYDKAIVLTMEMDKKMIDKAPSPDTAVMVMQTYSKLGKVVIKISDFLRKNGYAACAGHPLLGQTLYPALAEHAGLGYHGHHGLIITPEFGPRIRIQAVYTDIENLPVKSVNEHEWIGKFCDTCNLCVWECPAQAISGNPLKKENGTISCINGEKCLDVAIENQSCCLCIKACQFNRTPYDELYEIYELTKNV